MKELASLALVFDLAPRAGPWQLFMWQAGEQVSAVSRGRGHNFSTDSRQILGNLLLAFSRVPDGDRCTIGRLVGLPQRQRGIDACVLVAHLTGLNIKTLRSLVARFEQKGWRDSGPRLAVGNDWMAGGLAATSVPGPAALDVVADLNDLRDRHDTALPAVHFPEDDTSNVCHDNTGSDSDADLQFGELPARSRPGQLAAWQQHSNYATGMRVAELATQWITRGQAPEFFRSL